MTLFDLKIWTKILYKFNNSQLYLFDFQYFNNNYLENNGLICVGKDKFLYFTKK
jgi:hypothetical protein